VVPSVAMVWPGLTDRPVGQGLAPVVVCGSALVPGDHLALNDRQVATRALAGPTREERDPSDRLCLALGPPVAQHASRDRAEAVDALVVVAHAIASNTNPPIWQCSYMLGSSRRQRFISPLLALRQRNVGTTPSGAW